MWDGLAILLLLSIVMGTASFLAGSLPLSISLSQRQLRLVTALGTGVLVGTSLIVIIPEGVETLYSTGGSGHSHDARGVSLARRVATIQSLEHIPAYGHLATRHESQPVALRGAPVDKTFITGPDDGQQLPGDAAISEPPSSDPGHEPGRLTAHPADGTAPHGGGESAAHDPHAWIGVSLILGFILMYLIDTVPRTAAESPQPQRFQISLNHFSLNRTASVSNDIPDTPIAANSAHTSGTDIRPSSTTVGLVIHAAADGIALGASSTGSSRRLSFVIFIALMIHKAPAAFGLTSVLLKQGLSKRMARTHLIVFSLAAPIGALLTWSAIHILGLSSDSLGESASAEFATGVLLLFSGGTFLYVAMHTMQENGASGHSHNHGMNGYAGVPSIEDPYGAQGPVSVKSASTGLADTLVTVGGMLLPLLTQFGHGH